MDLATVLRRARLALDLALGQVLARLGTQALEVWIEDLTQPGISLLEASGRGREPWTAFGIQAVVAGASAALLVGTLGSPMPGSRRIRWGPPDASQDTPSLRPPRLATCFP